MSWKKSFYFLFLILITAVFFLTGCGDADEQNVRTGEMDQNQVLTHNIGVEPETLDPAKMKGIPEATVAYALFDGLTRMTAEGLQPAVAESWEVSPDGLTYTFHLRNTKWNNGDPVTAQDFEYAWKRVLDPDTASEYAYQLYYIKNGQAYNEEKIKDPEQVGVKALDEKTLQVTLENPTPYFLSLTSFYTFFPVHRATVKAHPDNWANSPETLIGNGPFNLAGWKHHAKIEAVRNEKYWDAENVKLDKVVFTMVEEASTYLTMWENGQIDSIESPPMSDIPRLATEGKLKSYPQLCTYHYIFNTRKPPLDNPKVRKALSLAIDRKKIVENVTKGGEVPALGFVPGGIPDAKPGSDFRKIGGNLFKDADIKEAQELLAEAGYPGGKDFPEIEILYVSSESHKMIAEVVQEMWKKNLGIKNVTLTNREWQVYLEKRMKGDFQVAFSLWVGDYLDPMTFLDVFVTGGPYNNGGWSNGEYDRLIKLAKTTFEQEDRMEAMHRAEEILIDEMAVMPVYFYVLNVCVKDYAHNVYWNPLGPPDFKQAWISKH